MPSFEPVPIIEMQSDEFVPDSLAHGIDSAFEPGAGGAAGGGVESAREAAATEVEPVEEIDLDAIRREGYEEGLAAGRAEFPVENLEALGRVTAALQEAGESIGGLQRSYLVAHRQAIVDLSLAIAGKLVGREIASDPEVLVGIVGAALALIEEPAPTVVRLAPVDLAAIETGDAPAFGSLRSGGDLEFVADELLEPGDVRVSAGLVEVDARLAGILARVREQLCEALEVDEEAG